MIEADKCAIIKKDVEERKASTEEDLRNAQPLFEQALAALDSIEKKDFTTAKSFATPPNGVPEVFSATIWLLAGNWAEIDVDPKTKKPKQFDWKAAQRLMKNPDVFVNSLKNFKDTVDSGLVPAGNVAYVKK